MHWTPYTILIVIGLILAVASLVKPVWQLLAVSVILMAAALLIGKT